MAVTLTIRSFDSVQYPTNQDEDYGVQATTWAQQVTQAINDSALLSTSSSFDEIVGTAAQVAAGTATQTTLTAAIAAISSGGTILIKINDYTISSKIVIDKSCLIQAEGPGCNFKADAGIASGEMLQISASDVIIKNIVMDQDAGTPDYGIAIDALLDNIDANISLEGTFATAMFNNSSNFITVEGSDRAIVGPEGNVQVTLESNDANAISIGSEADSDMVVFDTTTGSEKVIINTDLDVIGSIDLESVKLDDLDGSHNLELKWDEDDTADRVFNFKVGTGNRTLFLNENLTVEDGQDVSLTAEDAAGNLTLDNVNFEAENTDATQRNIKITSAKAGDTTLTLEEDLTVADGHDITISAEDAASYIVLDNANFEVENTDVTQRDIKITSAKAGTTILTLQEDLTVEDGQDVSLTAEDAATSIVMDNANFEVENTDATQRDIKITSSKAGNTTLTFEEDFSVSDGYAITVVAEDASPTVTFDNVNFEVESTDATQRKIKITSDFAGDSTFDVNNPSVEDVSVSSHVEFTNQAESRYYEQTVNGTNYIGFEAPDEVTTDTIFKLPDGDGTASQVLKTDGSKNLGWATVATTSLNEDHVRTGDSSNVQQEINTDLLGDVIAQYKTATVTFDETGGAAEDICLWTSHGLTEGQTVYFQTTGSLPTGLSVDTLYYVKNPDTNYFQLSSTRNGDVIEITGDGSATTTAYGGGLSYRNYNKFQIKVLSSNWTNATGTGTMFTFSNLTAGKAYKVTFTGHASANNSLIEIRCQDGSGSYFLRWANENSNTNFQRLINSSSTIRVMDNTSFTVQVTSISGTATIYGSASDTEYTHCLVEELNDYIETSEW